MSSVPEMDWFRGTQNHYWADPGDPSSQQRAYVMDLAIYSLNVFVNNEMMKVI